MKQQVLKIGQENTKLEYIIRHTNKKMASEPPVEDVSCCHFVDNGHQDQQWGDGVMLQQHE